MVHVAEIRIQLIPAPEHESIPYDEPPAYPSHPDVSAIITKLLNIRTDGELKGVCWRLFGECFADEIALNCDSSEYKDAVFDIWKKYCR